MPSDKNLDFDSAHQRHLKELDREYAAIRAIAADPDWCNDDYRSMKACLVDFKARLRKICSLNASRLEVPCV